ncbi:MAG: hypothetical protein Q4P13_11320 [Psychrobacter sp.]|nr:hypothetical protein [Psychrobacter sp.]
MRFFLSSVAILLSIPSLVLLSYAQQSHPLGVDLKTQESMHGVFVQTQNDKLLKTTNETYLLLDKNKVIDDLSESQPGVVVQSFRVCLSGTLMTNTQPNRTQYPKIFVVKNLCANS